ncbi:alpha/beta fold hydrolase [Corynebacterium halotolerans]|uniref:Hydrolase n=1 Tax=Corynebacterium halotolerans YIM 70093 = DSM 44683 TaxID=1121362 RepID=M1MUD4_9CORY|nr:alpha/beta hydrolase [Corynebacterium halotolerans]AGF71349.1 hydrolase [Corynebacterium halotolerans YIM 70093 = DSM 44683]
MPTSRRPVLPPSTVELPGPFTHQLVHTRGLRLHAAVAGNPGDPLIVLLHGAFGGWFDFAEVIAPLAETGFHVAAVDARGYGMSDKPPGPYGGDLPTAVDDVSGLILALGHDSAVVVGSDTGGTIAWALAANHPERVRALISVSSAHPVDLRRSIAARPWEFPWMIARTLLSRLPGPLLYSLPGLIPAAYHRQLRLNTAAGFHRSPRFTELLDLRRRAAAIGNARPAILRNNRLLASAVPAKWMGTKVTAPTLLIQPPQGAWPHLAARSADRVTGGLETVAVPGTKNLPQVEDPAGFVRVVRDYLTRIDVAPRAD